VEEPARALGAVSECQGQRPRSVQESRYAGDHLSEGAGLWRVAVSLFGRALTDWRSPTLQRPSGNPAAAAHSPQTRRGTDRRAIENTNVTNTAASLYKHVAKASKVKR